jgi:hypothetical protein
VVLSAVEASNLDHFRNLFQPSLPSIGTIHHGKVITHALAGDTEPQLLPIAEVHMRSEESLHGKTPPWEMCSTKKKTFVYLLKKGVLCQNLGPQQYWTMYVFNCCDQSFSWLNMTIVQDVLQAFVRLRTLRVWRSSAASSCRMLGNQALEVLPMAQESDLLTACLPNTANIQA